MAGQPLAHGGQATGELVGIDHVLLSAFPLAEKAQQGSAGQNQAAAKVGEILLFHPCTAPVLADFHHFHSSHRICSTRYTMVRAVTMSAPVQLWALAVVATMTGGVPLAASITAVCASSCLLMCQSQSVVMGLGAGAGSSGISTSMPWGSSRPCLARPGLACSTASTAPCVRP
nr:MAG TPA: hypothetical protein [Caudoviricetes sp.]